MSTKKTDQTLQKCEELIERLQQLKKALGDVTNVSSNRKPVNALGIGWSQDPGTGAFHHSTHGVISTHKTPEGAFEIKHGGGVVGRVGDISQAGAMIRDYVGGLGNMATGMQNRMSPQMPSPTKMGQPTQKSDYGKFKGGSQYDPAASARRKMHNVGGERFGTQAVKPYSKNPFKSKVPSGPAGPVKQYTPEQIAAINEARKLKKTAEEAPWVTHNPVPRADAVPQEHFEKAEEVMANQLANMMAGKKLFNQRLAGQVPLFGMEPPPQPTNEQMFGHLVPSEEQLQKAEYDWANRFNSFFIEASKPISARFSSPEEEEAYWDSIKVSGGSGRDDYGF